MYCFKNCLKKLIYLWQKKIWTFWFFETWKNNLHSALHVTNCGGISKAYSYSNFYTCCNKCDEKIKMCEFSFKLSYSFFIGQTVSKGIPCTRFLLGRSVNLLIMCVYMCMLPAHEVCPWELLNRFMYCCPIFKLFVGVRCWMC